MIIAVAVFALAMSAASVRADDGWIFTDKERCIVNDDVVLIEEVTGIILDVIEG